MREIKNYICIVDGYRRPSRKRNTAGRYRVGAKTEKEAREFLQKAIGFGSVDVYYEDKDSKTKNLANYSQCFREQWNGSELILLPVKRATEKREE